MSNQQVNDNKIDDFIKDILGKCFPLLCLSVIVPLASLLMDSCTCNSNPNFWFQRSGSISVLLCACIEFMLLKIDRDINPSPSSYTIDKQWNEKYGSEFNFISKSSLIVLLLGTLIWGYGDIPFKNPQTNIITQQFSEQTQGSDESNFSANNMQWENKDVVMALGVALTFILGIWNLYANFRTGERTIFINTVTSQRIQWIEQLRQDISKFSGLIYHLCTNSITETQEKQQITKEIDRLKHVIRLRLNPNGDHDKTIERLLIETSEHITNQEKIKKTLEELTITSQALLKEEWEKVKKESKKGPLSDRA